MIEEVKKILKSIQITITDKSGHPTLYTSVYEAYGIEERFKDAKLIEPRDTRSEEIDGKLYEVAEIGKDKYAFGYWSSEPKPELTFEEVKIRNCKWRVQGRMRLEQYDNCNHPEGQNKLRKCPYRGDAALGVCQLYEPKPDEGGLIDFTLILSGQGTDYQKFKHTVEAQRDLTASILKKKYEANMKHLSHLIDDVIELEEKVKSKDAECQERVDKLVASYTEYIETRKSDLTGMPSRSIPHSMALQVRRDTLDFALKAFLELANK